MNALAVDLIDGPHWDQQAGCVRCASHRVLLG